MAGGEVVAAIEDNICLLHQFRQAIACSAFCQRDHVDLGVDVRKGLFSRFDFRLTDALGRMQDLALQVGQVDRVVIDQRDSSDAGRGKVVGGRRTQAASAKHQRVSGKQPFLAFDADFIEQDMT
jgi:hypothetical protein